MSNRLKHFWLTISKFIMPLADHTPCSTIGYKISHTYIIQMNFTDKIVNILEVTAKCH